MSSREWFLRVVFNELTPNREDDAMRRYFVAAAAVVALLVTGCGGSEDLSSTSTYTPVTTTSAAASSIPSRSTETQSTTTTMSSIPMVKAKGANAAPNQAFQGFYVNTQEAATDFGAWWRYELQLRDDEQRGVQQAYIDGIAACGIRANGKTPEAAVGALEQMGWTGGGAAAIYAAAVRTLCTHYDFGASFSDGTILGWKTYFDKQVNLSYPLVLQAMVPFGLRSQPNRIDVGWFGKYTCTYLQTTNTSIGLLDYLMTEGKWLALSETRGLAQAAAKAVVTHMCPGYMDAVLAW